MKEYVCVDVGVERCVVGGDGVVCVCVVGELCDVGVLRRFRSGVVEEFMVSGCVVVFRVWKIGWYYRLCVVFCVLFWDCVCGRK